MSETEQELKPGRSTDRLCAAKLGYEWLELDGAFGSVGRWVEPGSQNSAYDLKMRYTEGIDQPRYSTSMDDAMELVEKAASMGFEFILYKFIRPTKRFSVHFEIQTSSITTRGYPSCESDSAPFAICKAFLALPDLGEIE